MDTTYRRRRRPGSRLERLLALLLNSHRRGVRETTCVDFIQAEPVDRRLSEL